MFGLGKKRTNLGKYLDRRGMKQEWLSSASKVNNRDTIGQLCSNDEKLPTMRTAKKILDALRKVDPTVKQTDFWEM
ncbi:transcriptional regulator [Brevibacillus sp. VP]|nr:transcriptional regulator [Brevibacillus sp. VP]